jgi:hypothetical protein
LIDAYLGWHKYEESKFTDLFISYICSQGPIGLDGPKGDPVSTRGTQK